MMAVSQSMLWFVELMMCSDVFVIIIISRCSIVFSQSRVKVSSSLTNVGRLAVSAFILSRLLPVCCWVRLCLKPKTLVNTCRNVVVGLWATRIL